MQSSPEKGGALSIERFFSRAGEPPFDAVP